jgi:hypothetical protein
MYYTEVLLYKLEAWMCHINYGTEFMNHESGLKNTLLSPCIDCRKCEGMHSFKRCR